MPAPVILSATYHTPSHNLVVVVDIAAEYADIGLKLLFITAASENRKVANGVFYDVSDDQKTFTFPTVSATALGILAGTFQANVGAFIDAGTEFFNSILTVLSLTEVADSTRSASSIAAPLTIRRRRSIAAHCFGGFH